MELKGKLGQSSVNGLLNNSSSVNPLHNTYSTLPRIHVRREGMAQRNISTLPELSECTITTMEIKLLLAGINNQSIVPIIEILSKF